MATAAGFACLVIVNNRISDLALQRAIALALFAPVLAVAAGSLAAPVLRIERESAWFLDVCAVPSFGLLSRGSGPAVASLALCSGFVYGSIVALSRDGNRRRTRLGSRRGRTRHRYRAGMRFDREVGIA